MNRLRSERGGDKIEKQIQKAQNARGSLNGGGHVSRKQIARDLELDKEIYFERHINKDGME